MSESGSVVGCVPFQPLLVRVHVSMAQCFCGSHGDHPSGFQALFCVKIPRNLQACKLSHSKSLGSWRIWVLPCSVSNFLSSSLQDDLGMNSILTPELFHAKFTGNCQWKSLEHPALAAQAPQVWAHSVHTCDTGRDHEKVRTRIRSWGTQN